MSSVNTSTQPNPVPPASSLPPLAPPVASSTAAPKPQVPVDAVTPAPAAPAEPTSATTLEATAAPAQRSQSLNQRFRAWAQKVWIQLCNKLFGRR